MSEKSPKHITDLTGIFDELKDGVIMYGFDPAVNQDKQLPLDLFISRFETIETRLTLLETSTAGTDIVISNFTITPSIGIYSVDHNYVLSATFDRPITHSDLLLFNLTYGVYTLDLIDNPNVIFTSNSVAISHSSLQGIALNENTAFVFTIRLLDGSIGTSNSIIYTNVPKVEILTFDMYETHDGGISSITSNFTISNYNSESSITALISDNAESNSISTTSTLSSNIGLVDFDPVSQLLASKNFTLTVTQSVGSDTIYDTASDTLVIIADEYVVNFVITDDIPEALPLVTIGVYNDVSLLDLRFSTTSDVSGEAAITLPNGTYYMKYTKDDYNEVTTIVEVNSVAVTEEIELVPVVYISSFSASAPVPETTMVTQYTLVPLQKYETAASIVYTITDALGGPVDVVTKTKSSPEDTTYKELPIDARWGNGYTIDMLLTSTYNNQTDTMTLTKTIGTLPVYFGIFEHTDIPDWYTTELSTQIATLVSNNSFTSVDPVGKTREYSLVGTVNNPYIYWQVIFETLFPNIGWNWIAFPVDEYDEYLWQYPITASGPYNAMSVEFETFDIVLGSSNYRLYFPKGRIVEVDGANVVRMGTPTPKVDTKFSISQFN